MRLRNVSVAMALLAVIATGPVRAQTPSSEAMAAAEELFAFLSKDLLAQITTQLTTLTWPSIERELASRVDAAALAELRREYERIQLDRLQDILKDAPAIYARRFTAQELREIVAFYRTPTGQKSLREMPQVMAEAVALIVPRMADIQREVQTSFGRVLRERGYVK
jgi:hypothetical protein